MDASSPVAWGLDWMPLHGSSDQLGYPCLWVPVDRGLESWGSLEIRAEFVHGQFKRKIGVVYPQVAGAIDHVYAEAQYHAAIRN